MYVVRNISPVSVLSLKYGGAIELSTHFNVAVALLSIFTKLSARKMPQSLINRKYCLLKFEVCYSANVSFILFLCLKMQTKNFYGLVKQWYYIQNRGTVVKPLYHGHLWKHDYSDYSIQLCRLPLYSFICFSTQFKNSSSKEVFHLKTNMENLHNMYHQTTAK